MPARTASRPSEKLVGKQNPRLWTPPLRPLNRRTSRGYEIVEFAELAGEPFLPWGQWLVKHAMELNPDGTYRFRVILVLAREQWQLAQETIHGNPDLEAEWGGVRNVNGDERFWLRSGGRYLIKAMNRKAGRGYSIDEANIDELREQHDWKAWSAVSKTLMARENAQLDRKSTR